MEHCPHFAMLGWAGLQPSAWGGWAGSLRCQEASPGPSQNRSHLDANRSSQPQLPAESQTGSGKRMEAVPPLHAHAASVRAECLCLEMRKQEALAAGEQNRDT